MKKNATEAQLPTADSLAELVEQAKAGDQNAFSELYTRTSANLYRCIRAMTRDEELTWDIHQDAYLRAFRSLNTLDRNEAFFPWLRRIAVNVTATRMAQRLPMTFTDLGGEDGELPDPMDLRPETQPELSLDRKESARLVQEILAKLPEEQQLILGMRYYDELSVKEIASVLKISTGAVKAQLFHGRKKVETAVRALEKQGLKLYGLSPLAFLLALMRRMEPSEAAARTAMKAVTKTVSMTATPVTASTFGQVLHGMLGKLALGLLSVAVVGGGIWAGSKLLSRSQPVVPDQPSETVTVAQLDTAESAENLDTTEAPTPDTEPATTEASEPTDSTQTEASAAPAALSGVCGEHLTWRFEPDSGTLYIEGSGAMTENEDVRDVPWYDYLSQITAVSLPEGLTELCNHAFFGCNALEQITLPQSLTRIGEMAFSACSGLETLAFPDGLTTIGKNAFTGCTGLYDLTLPAGLTSISDFTFQWCTGLNTVTFPETLTSIGWGAFSGCTSLYNLYLPEGVTTVSNSAFSECSGLSTVSLPESVAFIGTNAFAHCTGLTELRILNADCSIGETIASPTQTTLCGFSGSTAEQYASENGFSFLPIATTATLDAILDTMEQDEAERAALDGFGSSAFGGVTKIEGIDRVGTRYLAKVVRTVSVTASEEALEQARQTEKLVLQGTEYRYTDSQARFEEWMQGPTIGENGIVLNGSRFYDVCKVGDSYIFVNSIGGLWSRIEEITDVNWVWLDGDTPLNVWPSENPDGGEVTLETYLRDPQNHITPSTICELVRSDNGTVSLKIDLR